MNPRIAVLSAMLAELALACTPNPQRTFLLERGWVPLGKNCSTGLEGWGKVIDRKAVTVDQPEALEMEGYKC